MGAGSDASEANPPLDLGSRSFRVVLALILLLLVSMTLVVASREGFSQDDFSFLSLVQRPDWSLLRSYFPFESRWWWAYRPLGMETYFWLCHRTFGLEPLPFFIVSLTVHFATGFGVHRIARQLGFAPQVALATAVLAVSRTATANEIFYGSQFHYVGCAFFSVVATTLFIDFCRSGSSARSIGSGVALLAALLCNEVALALPVLFVCIAIWSRLTDDHAIWLEPARRGSMREVLVSTSSAGPQLLVAAGFAFFRYRMLGPAVMDVSYATSTKPWHVFRHLRSQIHHVFADPGQLAVVGVLIVTVALTIGLRRDRARLLAWLLPNACLCLIWCLGVAAPFSILVRLAPRFSAPLEVPLSLLVGCLLHVLWTVGSRTHRRLAEVALLLLMLAALPYQTLWSRGHQLRGGSARSFMSAVDEYVPNLRRVRTLIVVYDAPGLAGSFRGKVFSYEVHGGRALVETHHPDVRLDVSFRRLSQDPAYKGCTRRCAYLQLMPDGSLLPMERRYAEWVPESQQRNEKTSSP